MPICVALLFTAFLVLRVQDVYVSAAMLSAFFMVLLDRPRVLELVGVGILAVAAIVVRSWVLRNYLISAGLMAAGLGFGAVVILIRRINPVRPETNRYCAMFTSVGLLTLCTGITPAIIFASSSWNVRTLDLYAFSFDGSLGFHPSFAVGKLFLKYSLFEVVCRYTYLFLPTAVGLTQFAWGSRDWTAKNRYFVLEAFVLMAALGWVLYQAFPATGPIYLMPQDFPNSPPSTLMTSHLFLEPVRLAPNILRNGMPSLHMAWALLVLYGLFRFGGVRRWLGMAFVFAIVMATMGMGEHYLVDLVVACPFTVAVLGLSATQIPWRDKWRTRAMAHGAVLTAAWLFVLRYETTLFWVSPAVPWAAIAATTGVSVYLGWRLMLAQIPAGEQMRHSQDEGPEFFGGLEDGSTA